MVLPIDAQNYEKRVAVATDPLDSFYCQLIGELDEQNGGFVWWAGYSDWKTLAMLSDYLIQLVGGVSESLLSASLAAKTHREKVTADQYKHKEAWQQGKNPLPLDAAGRRRALEITQSAESCSFHLGQALDRLAVAIIIVGGFEINDAVKLDWGTVEEAAEELKAGSARERYQPANSPGRTAQEALVAPALDWHPFGPDEWFPWMRDTRNGITHRAPASKMLIVTTDQKLARVFYRQARWSELQALVYGAKPPNKPFFGTYVMTASEDTLDGLCESTAKLIKSMTDAMTTCWSARQANPQMIVQHGRQWRLVEPTEPMSRFPGYGPTITPAGDYMRMHPQNAKRWEAARVTNDRRKDWY